MKKEETMRKVRYGVFETNSSSSHSIVIAERNEEPDRLEMNDGVARVYPGEYGWQVESYRDADTKASYALTYAKQVNRTGLEEMLKRVILRVMGARDVEFVEASDDYYRWGYIDHQAVDDAARIFESEEVLERFIFNPHSILYTDNDNH